MLVSLAVGYWFGGRFADRHPHKQGLCVLVLVAALAVCAIPFVADPFLDISVDALDDVSAGAFIGSLVAVSVLVAPPVMLLGAASPYAIRLAVERVEESGTVAGRMYAISTIGSLAGTWTSALLLVPLVGTRRTFLIFGLVCAMVAVTGIARRAALAVPAVIVALLALPVGTIKAAGDGMVLEEAETEYQYARVVEEPDGERKLELNEGQAVHSLYRPGLLSDRRLLGRVPRAAVRRALVAAPGGGDPRQRRRHHGARPRALLPGHVGRCGRDRLRADHAGAAVVRPAQSPDARAPRGRAAVPAPDLARYDAIMVDVYRQPYIPFYLATREFFELVRDHLHSGWGGGRERRPSRGPGRPRKGAVGHDGGGVRDRRAGSERGHQHAGRSARMGRCRDSGCARAAARACRPICGRWPRSAAGRLAPALEGGEVYTDDRAPVEWLVDKSIVDYAADGE